MGVCDRLREIIIRNGFEIWSTHEDSEKCGIDFRHPKIKVEPPVGYFLSSVVYYKDRDCLETTVRSKVTTFKELYLDYCCEDSNCVCRPHVNMEEKILSVEATFCEKPFEKFSRLLDEMR